MGASGKLHSHENKSCGASAEENEKLETPIRLDGGTTAWTQVGMAFLVVFSTQGYFNSFGVFQSYYDSEFNSIGPSAVSWIGSVQVWLVLGLGVLSGGAVDAGYFRVVYSAGFLIQLTGIFMASLAKEFWQVFLSHGVCVGLGAGLMFAPALAVLTSYFSARRSIAVALTTCGGALGGTIFPIMVQHLIPQVGLSWTLRIVGLIMVVNLLAAFGLSRPRISPLKRERKFTLDMKKDLSYILFTVSSFFCFWALYFGYYYLSIYARDELKFSYQKSVTIVLVLNAVGIPVRLLVAYLADTFFHPQDVHLCSLFGAAVTLFGWIPVKNSRGLFIVTAFYGAMAGAIQTLFLAVSSSFVKDTSVAGFYIGLVCTVVSFATLTGPPVGGAIVNQHRHTYMGGEIWSGASMMLSFLILLISRALQVAKAQKK